MRAKPNDRNQHIGEDTKIGIEEPVIELARVFQYLGSTAIDGRGWQNEKSKLEKTNTNAYTQTDKGPRHCLNFTNCKNNIGISERVKKAN